METKNKKQATKTPTPTETKNMETEVIQMEHNTGITNQSGLSIDAADIDIPRINIVQKTSDISAPIGAVVIDKQHIIQEAEEVRQVTVISALKGWREDIPYDDDGIPKIAYSRKMLTASLQNRITECLSSRRSLSSSSNQKVVTTKKLIRSLLVITNMQWVAST